MHDSATDSSSVLTGTSTNNAPDLTLSDHVTWRKQTGEKCINKPRHLVSIHWDFCVAPHNYYGFTTSLSQQRSCKKKEGLAER